MSTHHSHYSYLPLSSSPGSRPISFTNPSRHRLSSGLRTDSTDFMTGPFLLSISIFSEREREFTFAKNRDAQQMVSVQALSYKESDVRVRYILQSLIYNMAENSWHGYNMKKLECGPMPNLMVALPNTGGALCSTPQTWLTPTTRCRAVTLPRRKTVEICRGAPNSRTDLSRKWAEVHHITRTCRGGVAA